MTSTINQKQPHTHMWYKQENKGMPLNKTTAQYKQKQANKEISLNSIQRVPTSIKKDPQITLPVYPAVRMIHLMPPRESVTPP